MTDPRISVCVPVYNGARYLEACFDSIRAQTFEDFEVVVVDDGSTDESPEIAAAAVARDPRFRLFRNDANLGLVGNWNRAVSLACGDWIKFVFQDDLIRPRCLETMAEHLSDDASLIACRRDFIFEAGVPDDVKTWYRGQVLRLERMHPVTRRLSPDDACELVLAHLCVNLFGEPTSVLLRRAVFERHGSFDPHLVMACDLEYWNRIAVNEGAVYIAETLADFRVHDAAVSADNRASREFRSSALDDLLVLRAYASDASYAGLRAYAARLSPAVDLDGVLAARKNEVRAVAAWSMQEGWQGTSNLMQALGDFYLQFPDLRPSRLSHLSWRLRSRLGLVSTNTLSALR